jgi:hypothetical protein
VSPDSAPLLGESTLLLFVGFGHVDHRRRIGTVGSGRSGFRKGGLIRQLQLGVLGRVLDET